MILLSKTGTPTNHLVATFSFAAYFNPPAHGVIGSNGHRYACHLGKHEVACHSPASFETAAASNNIDTTKKQSLSNKIRKQNLRKMDLNYIIIAFLNILYSNQKKECRLDPVQRSWFSIRKLVTSYLSPGFLGALLTRPDRACKEPNQGRAWGFFGGQSLVSDGFSITSTRRTRMRTWHPKNLLVLNVGNGWVAGGCWDSW